MAPNKKYLSLEDAAGQLGVKPDELIRLRERGQVRGFADQGTWKFKADDIEEYRRSQQPDSDPDLMIMDDDDDQSSGRQSTFIRPGLDSNSDSDVRLIQAEDPKKKRLSGSSGEVSTFDLQKSDSDVRLVEDPKAAKSKPLKKGSDSDVKLVKPNVEAKSDSDSDVKMVSSKSSNHDSDSDVEVLEPLSSLVDSDSDVRMAASDSDVRLAPLMESDSDVKLIGKTSSLRDSDSDVKLLPRGSRSKNDDDLPLAPMDFSDSDDDASILLDGDDDSSITLAGDSGIQLSGDSGIRLSGDSGIRLSEESGVQLMQPADSGISLEGMDSAVRFADSGISLGEESGIRLGGSSGTNPKTGGGKKRKRDAQEDLRRTASDEDDDIAATSPMLLSGLDEDDLSADEMFQAGDTSEMQALGDSDQSVVLFEDDEDDEPKAAPSKKKKKAKNDSVFELDDAPEEPLEELEVSDDDLSDDGGFGDLDFDDREAGLDDSFSEGSSQMDFVSPRKVAVVKEVEWSAGVCGLLFVSLCVLVVGSIVSADLLRTVWARAEDSSVDVGLASILTGIW